MIACRTARAQAIDPAITATVPTDEAADVAAETEPASTTHTEIQYRLLKLGSDMGFDVHVTMNDQSRQWEGQRLGDMPRRRDGLPKKFGPVTNRTIELIDVPWLSGNSIEAAFEVENTTCEVLRACRSRTQSVTARHPQRRDSLKTHR